MPQQARNGLDVRPVAQDVGGERMSGAMPRYMLVNARALCPVAQRLQAHRMARKREDQIVSPPFADEAQQTVVEGDGHAARAAVPLGL